MTPNKNTRAQASAPDGAESVVSLINTCFGWVSAVARNGSLAYAAKDDIKREITNLFTRSNAKAGEVESLVSKWLCMSQVCTSDEIGSTQAAAFHHCAHELRAVLSTHDKTKA